MRGERVDGKELDDSIVGVGSDVKTPVWHFVLYSSKNNDADGRRWVSAGCPGRGLADQSQMVGLERTNGLQSGLQC